MKKILFILPIISCFLGCGNSNQIADTVVLGTIYTAEKDNNGLAEAFAVKDGKYIYVGNKKDVEKYIQEGKTTIINNEKGLTIPGATEGHGHFIGIDSIIKKLPCLNEQYEAIKEELAREMKLKPKPKFFMSWGLLYEKYMEQEDGWDKTICYADELNEIAHDIPVVCFDNSGHQALCNTFALKQAGLINGSGEIQEVRGGTVIKTTSASPTYSGWVSDELAPYVVKKCINLSELGENFFIDAVKNAVSTLNERGFTNYLEAYINYLSKDDFYRAINKVDLANELNVNVSSFDTIRSFEDKEYKARVQEVKSLANEYKSPHFDPHNIKLFADGVTESRTGWLLEPYQKGGDYYGNKIWEQEELNNLVYESNKEGLNVHTHTFGDAACRAVINAYIDAENRLGKHYNNTLAHVRNITTEDIVKAAEHHIGMAENIIWHSTSDEYDALLWQAILAGLIPEDIALKGYPMKSLIDAGVLVSSSTDAPCGEQVLGNIQNVIEVATTGITPTLEGSSYNKDELLSVREVLECLTINGAKQLRIDDKCGSIKVGKNADFVTMDTNFLNYTKLEDLRTIHNTKINSVYFEGNIVFPKK
ncbi:MAG: amidohydrolase family protein [Bacilli bacterium]|nr:amidohydrolase family protein [Bacilli bacterium]